MAKENGKNFALIDFAVYEGWEDHLTIWETALNVENSTWKRYKSCEGEFPSDEELDSIQGIVIPGSRYSANDNWTEAYSFVRKVVNRGSPQLYCGGFGSQLLAVAFDGEVGANRYNKFKFGSEDIQTLSHWVNHPILSKASKSEDIGGIRMMVFIKEIRLLKTHGQCVTKLPSGAKLAAFSPTCLNEVWFIGNNVLAMQSHPEFTVKLMEDRILPKLSEKGILSPPEVVESKDSLALPLNDDDVMVLDLIRQFLLFSA